MEVEEVDHPSANDVAGTIEAREKTPLRFMTTPKGLAEQIVGETIYIRTPCFVTHRSRTIAHPSRETHTV